MFIAVWLLGDFFNIFGAVLQGVLPTMTILAVYYTLADIVLLLQCFWYKGFTLRDEVKKPGDESHEDAVSASERSPLLSENTCQTNGAVRVNSYTNGNGHEITPPVISDIDRRHSIHSQRSFRERYLSIDGTHLSPVTPLRDESPEDRIAPRPRPVQSTLQTVLFNTGTIILVCTAGVFGWWLSASRAPPSSEAPDSDPSSIEFNLWGQVFGYICAALYLGSRVPQLLLNYRRKSTEGISMLFFVFACLGNLTYVLSILVYKPRCKDTVCRGGEASGIYGRYIAVNFSWLLGSFGTLVLDACVFVQYFIYRKEESESESEMETDSESESESESDSQ